MSRASPSPTFVLFTVLKLVSFSSSLRSSSNDPIFTAGYEYSCGFGRSPHGQRPGQAELGRGWLAKSRIMAVNWRITNERGKLILFFQKIFIQKIFWLAQDWMIDENLLFIKLIFEKNMNNEPTSRCINNFPFFNEIYFYTYFTVIFELLDDNTPIFSYFWEIFH